MSPASTSIDGDMSQRHCDEIFALRDQVRKDRGAQNDNDNDDANENENYNGGDNNNGDGSGSIIVTSAILESTIVPAMKDLSKEQNDSIIEEKKDTGDNSSIHKKTDHEKNRVEYTIAILECLVSFVAATCAVPQAQESPKQQTSYNSLSFRRATTPKKEKKPSLKPEVSSNPKEDKTFFVRCGAFEMAVRMLREVLEDHVSKASSASWSRNKSADLDTFDSIGVADSSADVKIESTMPENEIPALVMHLIACLTHNASDAIKTDVILPQLTSIVHKSMMVFLPSPEVQAYGCWTLHSLSNPLLQELIAAGSVSVLVRAMKRHHSDALVQEHGNKSLYNLLPLLAFCTNQNDKRENNNYNSETNSNPVNQNPASAPAPAVLIEIDGERLEDYSSLIPGLPAIVLRGMESHPDHLAIQQYGLLVLTRLCQQDQESYEIVISEGGLTALLNVVMMTTNAKLNLRASDHNLSGYDDPYVNDNNKHSSTSEKYDCLAQMACQFLRDISRPTNSSMDILRIIAVKGGMKTVLKLLDHYNQENLRCGGVNSGISNYYGNNQQFAIINIVDPAMACLRNLMTNEDNRREVVTFLSMSKALQQEQKSSSNNNPYGNNDDDDDTIQVCANLIPIVLKTMDAYPLDAPIQAYGCDLLGRLAQGEQAARIELIKTTIDPDAFSASGRARLWKKSDSHDDPSGISAGNGAEDNGEDAEIVDLSDQMSGNVVSTSPKYKKQIDALMTVVRAMRNHRNHKGVQERTVALILAMVIDRDAMFNGNGDSSTSQSSSSFYLIQRLQEVYDLQRDKDNPATFLAFLQSTLVPPKGVERLKALTKIVDEYDRKKTRGTDDDPSNSSGSGLIGKFLRRGWN